MVKVPSHTCAAGSKEWRKTPSETGKCDYSLRKLL